MNGTTVILDELCPEGSIVQRDGQTLVVFFDHITRGMPCTVDLRGAVVPQLTLFTAKGLPDAEVVQGVGRSYDMWGIAVGVDSWKLCHCDFHHTVISCRLWR